MAIGISTYQDASIREDLLSILKDVSALGRDDNYLMNTLGSSKAKSTLHEWVVYHEARPTSVTAVAEGAAAAVADLTAPSRSENYTAILTEVIQATGTEREVDVATGQDPMMFQKEKGLRRLKAKMEYALLNGTSARSAGSSGVARQMAGIDGSVTTHVTARASGTSMSVTEIEDIMEELWADVSGSFIGSTLLVPFGIKRTISGFSTPITNFVNQTDKLYQNISTFQGSAGEVKVVPHRDVRNVAGTSTVYLIKDDTFKAAYLREPQWKELAVTGDYDWGQYLTELTLESLAQRASAKRTGYKKEAV